MPEMIPESTSEQLSASELQSTPQSFRVLSTQGLRLKDLLQFWTNSAVLSAVFDERHEDPGTLQVLHKLN